MFQKQMKDGQEASMIGAKTTGNGQHLDTKLGTTILKQFRILIMNQMTIGNVQYQIQKSISNGLHLVAYKKNTLYVKQNLIQSVQIFNSNF